MTDRLVERNAGIALAGETLPRLAAISTATATLILLKHGIRACFIDGARPVRAAGCRFVAEAFTLRFIPMREDLSHPDVLGDPDYAPRKLIEEIPAGSALVIDARGVTNAGTVGEILVARLQERGCAALVTDGAVRDIAAASPSCRETSCWATLTGRCWCRVRWPTRSPARPSNRNGSNGSCTCWSPADGRPSAPIRRTRRRGANTRHGSRAANPICLRPDRTDGVSDRLPYRHRRKPQARIPVTGSGPDGRSSAGASPVVCDQAMSKRSAFITFVQAATKSLTNFAALSSWA